MKNKNLLAILASIALVLPTGMAAQAAESFDPGALSALEKSLFLISEINGGYTERRSWADSNGLSNEALCLDGFDSGLCDVANKKRRFYSSQVLPVCKTDEQENCLEGFEFIKEDGTVVKATYLRNVAGDNMFPPITKLGVYEGSTPSLWTVEGMNHTGGTNTYAASVVATAIYSQTAKRFVTERMTATVLPYLEVTGSQYEQVQYRLTKESNGNYSAGYSGGGVGLNCAWAENGLCGKLQEFTPDTRIKMVTRLSSDISGWFKGRMEKPELAIEKFSKANVRVSVAANPTSISRFVSPVAKSEITPALDIKWTKEARTGGGTGSVGLSKGYGANPDTATALLWLERHRKVVADTAAGISSSWNFGTMRNESNNSCLEDSSRVLGLVTTNATAYEAGPPKFKGGFLNYTVSGLHYLPGGTDLSLGQYDLIMRSDVARCLYNFSNAPLSATVSVVNDKGTKVSATTVVREKSGWLSLRASGFTFSKKIIKVKISKKKK